MICNTVLSTGAHCFRLSGLELPSDESVILMEDELNVKQQLFDEYISQKEGACPTQPASSM